MRAAAVQLRHEQVAAAQARAAVAQESRRIQQRVAATEARAAAEVAAATEELHKEQAAAAQARAEAEELMAAAESLKKQVAAAEARAAAAEVHAADEVRSTVNETSETSSASGDLLPSDGPQTDEMSTWLGLLANGEFHPLGEVEVISAMSEAAVQARALTKGPKNPKTTPGHIKVDTSCLSAAARQEWLKSLDVAMWHRAAMSLSEAASEAAGMAELTAMCDSGDEVSCRILSEQEEDTEKWLQKLNVPNWGAAAAVLSVASSDAAAVSAAALEALEGYGFLKNRLMIRELREDDGRDDD